MNIFAYHPEPEQSALWLDDVRKNKMIVESCQLLSTAMNVLLPNHGMECYKTSYLQHPCAVWARLSYENFVWLLSYTEHLHKQRGTDHKSASLFPVFRRFASQHHDMFPIFRRTPFVNCARNVDMGLDFTYVENTYAAYRLYHRARWQRDTIPVTWRHGQKPKWSGL